jgi:hypothetical protein
MSDILDVQIQLYPELLRRMAAGEKLASTESDESEKLAASMIVAEAIENERAAEAAEAPAHQEKKAILEIGLGTAALLGLAAPKIKEMVQKARGVPHMPETSAELTRSFRGLLEEQAKTQAAKRTAVGAALGGAAAGALATKALEKKDRDEKDSAAAEIETVKNADAPSARAVLDKLLKNFV